MLLVSLPIVACPKTTTSLGFTSLSPDVGTGCAITALAVENKIAKAAANRVFSIAKLRNWKFGGH
jgi:hypothetical protein